MNSDDIRKWIENFLETVEYSGEYNSEQFRNSNNKFIYNEFSLQHELGIALREKVEGTGYVVEFERNRKFFGIHSLNDFQTSIDKNEISLEPDESEIHKDIVKSEIDIVIYNPTDVTAPKYAIELKFPLKGQYPEQMFKFIEDISFLEQLNADKAITNAEGKTVKNSKPFSNCFAVTVVNDPLFWRYTRKRPDDEEDGNKIYDYFRALDKYGNKNDYLHSITSSIEDPVHHKKATTKKVLNIKQSYNIEWKLCHKKDEEKTQEEINNALHYYIVDIPKKIDIS